MSQSKKPVVLGVGLVAGIVAGVLLVSGTPWKAKEPRRDSPKTKAPTDVRAVRPPPESGALLPEREVRRGEVRNKLFEPPQPSARRIAGIFPLGTFGEAPSRFLWTSDPRAQRYRLEIRDETDHVVYSHELADTVLAWPSEELAGHANKILSWTATPLVDDRDGVSSEPARVLFQSPGPDPPK